MYQRAGHNYLLDFTGYDDGVDFGSAVRLVGGALPYRDFVLIQPPGISLLREQTRHLDTPPRCKGRGPGFESWIGAFSNGARALSRSATNADEEKAGRAALCSEVSREVRTDHRCPGDAPAGRIRARRTRDRRAAEPDELRLAKRRLPYTLNGRILARADERVATVGERVVGPDRIDQPWAFDFAEKNRLATIV